MLFNEAGKDATEAFEDVGHSDHSREMLANYEVGTLVGAVSYTHKRDRALAAVSTLPPRRLETALMFSSLETTKRPFSNRRRCRTEFDQSGQVSMSLAAASSGH